MADAPPKDLTQLTDLPLMSEQELAQSAESSPAPALEMPTPEPASEADFDLSLPAETAAPLDFAPAPEVAPPLDFAPAPSPLEEIVAYEAPRASVAASDPFTLRITGPLRAEERSRLLDILARENLGIREVDLEPQFQGAQVLIPRISEYLGVQIVQALRGASVTFELAPSDVLPEARVSPAFHARVETQLSQSDTRMRFEDIPLTQDTELPGMGTPIPIDVVMASATLTSVQVEARHSQVFEEILENLKRELKARAFYRGAHAITGFESQLTPLKDPGLYRLQLTGSAVKLTGAAPVPPDSPVASDPFAPEGAGALDSEFLLPE